MLKILRRRHRRSMMGPPTSRYNQHALSQSRFLPSDDPSKKVLNWCDDDVAKSP